jgi:hypothetical protein
MEAKTINTIMKKSAKNAKWNGLTPAQRDQLEGWLFDERLSYPEALKLAQKEFGFTGSVPSLRRFYHRTAEARLLTDAVKEAAEARPALSEGEARAVSMKALGNLLVRQITENPDDIKEWWLLAKLLLQSQENELRERLHREENDIRREYLDLARARFHWNAVEDAEKALPEIHELAQKRKDPKVRSHERAMAMNAVRRKLFGSVSDPEPESEEHAAELAEFEKQRKSLKPEDFARYALEKIRAMRAKGHHEEVIARRVDASVVDAAKWAEAAECGTGSAEGGMAGTSPKSEVQGPKLEAATAGPMPEVQAPRAKVGDPTDSETSTDEDEKLTTDDTDEHR